MTRVALLCSAHGFGHVARQLAVAEVLMERGADVTLWTAAPEDVVRDYLPAVRLRAARLDVGLVQQDSLHEEPEATAVALEALTTDAHVDGIAAGLAGTDAVVVDAAPAALEGARRAGVPAVLASNFDWAWIYRHYAPLREVGARFARWQAPHPALRMTPGPGLFGFASVEDVGVVGRWRPPVRVTEERAVLVSFGGLGLDGLDALLPRVPGVRWLLAPPMAPLDRPDCTFVTGVSYPAMVGGADLVLTKPGYGIYAETALAGTPVILVRRHGFPEAPSLEAAFVARGDVVIDGTRAELRAALAAAVAGPARRRSPTPSDGAARIADRVLALAVGRS